MIDHDDGDPGPSDDDAPANVIPIRKGRKPKDKPADWRGLLLYSDRGKVVSSTANVATIIAHDEGWKDVLRYEVRAARVVFAKPPPLPEDMTVADEYPREVTDADLTRVAAWLERKYQFTAGATTLSAAIDMVADQVRVDPVKDYLDGLTWDGNDRAAMWLHEYLGVADSPYSRAVAMRWLISAVARVYLPGCQADHVLVLEGAQGKGKSSSLIALMPEREWYADGIHAIGQKDSAEELRGPWVVEVSELDAFGRADMATVKAFVSRRVDRFREAYGTRARNYPRRCVFAGTTNDDQYLKDPTGSRRFWPVETRAIDLEGLRTARNQLWAEARARFQKGEQWHLDAAEADLASVETSLRTPSDPWVPTVAAWVKSQIGGFTTADVAIKALDMKVDRVGPGEARRIASCLRDLGYAQSKNAVQFRGDRARVWERQSNTDAQMK